VRHVVNKTTQYETSGLEVAEANNMVTKNNYLPQRTVTAQNKDSVKWVKEVKT